MLTCTQIKSRNYISDPSKQITSIRNSLILTKSPHKKTRRKDPDMPIGIWQRTPQVNWKRTHYRVKRCRNRSAISDRTVTVSFHWTVHNNNETRPRQRDYTKQSRVVGKCCLFSYHIHSQWLLIHCSRFLLCFNGVNWVKCQKTAPLGIFKK